jgi:hypothetical protein
MNTRGQKNTRSRKSGARPLGELAPTALSPAAAKLGFGEADIVLHWPDIAGARLAQVSEPERLQWPVRAKKAPPEIHSDPAALVLRVEGAFAVEIQHLAPLLIERINTRLGWRCIGRIILRQGPVRRRPAGRGKVPPPSPSALEAAGKLTGGIAESGLRDALNRLGARALNGTDGRQPAVKSAAKAHAADVRHTGK